jgi:DNA-directed RNA polymerase subunit K/omega
MSNLPQRDAISLSSEDTVHKLGNQFDAVLVLSQRIREIKSGHAPMVNQGNTPLSTTMHEIQAGKVNRSWLLREPPETNSRNKGRR